MTGRILAPPQFEADVWRLTDTNSSERELRTFDDLPQERWTFLLHRRDVTSSCRKLGPGGTRGALAFRVVGHLPRVIVEALIDQIVQLGVRSD